MNADAFAIENHFAGIGWRDSEENAREFGSPSANQPSQPDNFTRTKVERDVMQTGKFTAEIFEQEHDFARRSLARRINVRDLTSDHHANEFRFGQSRRCFRLPSPTPALTP